MQLSGAVFRGGPEGELRTKAATRGALYEKVLLEFHKIHRKTSGRPKTCNFIKKETLTQVFSSEFCENSENTFFTEQLRSTASVRKIFVH